MILKKLKKDAFKQENPDLEIFEQMGAGAPTKTVVHVMWMVDLSWQVRLHGFVSKEETDEEILKKICTMEQLRKFRRSLSLGRSCKKC